MNELAPARYAVEVVTKKEGSTFPLRTADEAEARARYALEVARTTHNRMVRLWLIGGGPGAPSMLLETRLEERPGRFS